MIGIERIERILVLQLCRQQLQKALKVARDLLVASEFAAAADVPVDELEAAVVPETTGLETLVVAISVPLDADIYAAARSEHAAIGSSRHHSRYGVIFADDQPLRVGV